MDAEDLSNGERMLHRFHRLVKDITRGGIARNSFEPWEVAILADFENCSVERRRRKQMLRQYERAVERQMATGLGPPMTLSEFLDRKKKAYEERTLRPSMR